jgi:hypothetical protein
MLVRKPEGKRQLERARYRGKHTFKTDLQETRKVGAWTGLIWLWIGTGGGHF